MSSCLAVLRKAFSDKVPEPQAVHVTRWGQDPCFHGSWTYYSKNSCPNDVTMLATPIGRNGCLTFAGEHTCDGSSAGLDMGTVHGAWLSGELAANRAMPAFQAGMNHGM